MRILMHVNKTTWNFYLIYANLKWISGTEHDFYFDDELSHLKTLFSKTSFVAINGYDF